MLDQLIKFFDSRTWFLMLLSLLIVIAYLVFLFTNNENTGSIQTFFNMIVGFWFGVGATVSSLNRVVQQKLE